LFDSVEVPDVLDASELDLSELPLLSEPPALEDEPSPELASEAAELLAFVRAPLVDERSFLAQPEPLKWTVGVDSAFFMVPSAPHDGQNLGPASLMPWITSVTCRQFEHR
jgi:hypothetical protein